MFVPLTRTAAVWCLISMPTSVIALQLSTFGAKRDNVAERSRGMVTITKSDWSGAPGGGARNAFIKARIASHPWEDIGNCGLEVLEVGADGLVNSERDLRPRAVLSGTLFVLPKFRRQGLAQRLLREAEGQARWMGVDEMILMVKKGNYAAQSLYEKMGYRKEPRTKDHGSEVCMRKHLYLSMHSLPSMVPQLTFIDTALAARR